MDFGEILVRLCAASVIGVGLGLDRQINHKSIGVRTLGLVALGSAAVVLAVTLDSVGGPARIDAVSRAVQGLVTGIGFLGAGVILRDGTDHKVKGLTTAATVWLAAIGGIICGMGLWKLVFATVLLAALILGVGGQFEKWVVARQHRQEREIGGGPEGR